MKTFKIASLHRVQSVRTCSEYTNSGVIRKSGQSQLQIDNFKWHLPLIYTHCLETIWNFLEKIHAFWYTSSHSQNASKLLTEKLPKYSKTFRWAGRDFAPWGLLSGQCPGPAGNLKQSPDPSPIFVPPSTKSWICPWYQWFINNVCSA